MKVAEGQAPVDMTQQALPVEAEQAQATEVPEEMTQEFEQDFFQTREPAVSLEDRYQRLGSPTADPTPQMLQQQKQEEKEKYENAYSKVRDVVQATLPGGTAAAFTLDLAAESIEDVANTALAAGEYIGKKFDNDFSIEKLDYISRTLPDSELQKAARTMLQLMSGYGAGMKAAKMKGLLDAGKLQKTRQNSARVLSTILTESTFNDVEDKMMSEQVLSALPFGSDVVEFLNSSLSDTAAEQRLKTGLYGLLDAAMAESAFAMFKAMRFKRQVKLENSTEETLQNILTPSSSPDMTYMGAEITRRLDVEPPPIPSLVKYSTEGMEAADAIQMVPRIKRDPTAPYNPNRLMMSDGQGNRVFRNLTTLDSTDELRLLMADFIEQNAADMGKDKITFDKIIEAARLLRESPEQIVAWEQASGLRLGQIFNARELEADMLDQFRIINNLHLDGKVSDQEFMLSYRNIQFVQRTISDMQTLSSALLRESAVPVKVGMNQARNQQALKLLAEGQRLVDEYGADAVKHLSRRLADADTASLSKIGNLSFKEMGDFLTQVRIGGMLSSPSLLVRNTLSSISMLGTDILETGAAATIGSARVGTQNLYSKLMETPQPLQARVEFGESMVMAHGVFQGIAEATILSGKQFIQNVPPIQRLFPDMTDPVEFLGVRAGKQKIPDQFIYEPSRVRNFYEAMKSVVSLPGMAVRWQDNFTKHVAMRMKLNQEAYRVSAKMIRDGAPTDMAVRIAEIKKGAVDKQTMDRLTQFAEEMTFTNDPITSAGMAIVGLTNPKGSMFNKMMFQLAPFARANVNAITYTMERVPLANLLIKRSRDNLFNAVDPRVRDLEIAKMTVLPTLLGTAAYMLNSKDAITGARPSREGNLFDQAGYQENSIRVGDRWIKYLPETPMGAVLSAFATMNQIQDLVQGQNDEYVQDMATIIMLSMKEMFNPEFLADGIGSLTEALMADDAEMVEKLLLLGGDLASQYVPFSSFARKVTREFTEEGQYVVDQRPGRGLQAFYQTLANRTQAAFSPDGMPKRRDFFGNPIKQKLGFGGFLSPFNASIVNSNPTMAEMFRISDASNLIHSDKSTVTDKDGAVIADIGVAIFRPPSRSIGIIQDGAIGAKHKQLNNSEYEKLSLYSAGIDPETMKGVPGGSYEEAMARLFKSPRYKNGSIHFQRLMAAQLHSMYMDMGKQMYLGKQVDRDLIRQANREFFDKFLLK